MLEILVWARDSARAKAQPEQKRRWCRLTNYSLRSHSIKDWPHGAALTTSQYLCFCYKRGYYTSRQKSYASDSNQISEVKSLIGPVEGC